MGIKEFGPEADEKAEEMRKALLSALRRDRKLRLESGEGSVVIRNLSKGERFDVDGDHTQEMLYWMDDIRDRFRGHVIRRTVTSLDYEGKQIIGLEPYHEHNLVVQLYDNEMVNLDRLASELANDCGASGAMFASGKVSGFHFFSMATDTLTRSVLIIELLLVYTSGINPSNVRIC